MQRISCKQGIDATFPGEADLEMLRRRTARIGMTLSLCVILAIVAVTFHLWSQFSLATGAQQTNHFATWSVPYEPVRVAQNTTH